MTCKHTTFQIAQRQISIHEINSTSWFSLVRKLLLQYDLPTALEVLTSPLTKTQWEKKNQKFQKISIFQKFQNYKIFKKFKQNFSFHKIFKNFSFHKISIFMKFQNFNI